MLLVVAGLSWVTGCVAEAPPGIGTATAGDGQAVVSWTAPPGGFGLRVTKYKVTPFIGSEAQTPIVFNSTATTQTITGLTNGNTYTFRVLGIDALGNEGASSGSSNPITYTRPPAIAVTGGLEHSCAVLADGTARCWGWNDRGRLGNGVLVLGDSANSSVPVTVTGMSEATAITAGLGHSCVVAGGGAVQCWGSNSNGQLGDNYGGTTATPVSVVGITDATAVTAGNFFHSCAVLAGGTAKCWGHNVFGQLGNGQSGTSGESPIPVSVTGITDATAIAGGWIHTCAVVAGGSVKCWGYNAYGQLGNGSTADSSTPVSVTGVTDASSVTAYGTHSCALGDSGAASCWGSNASGELGNGTTVDSSTPVSVTGIIDAIGITAGGYHSCALFAGGTVSCWGRNTKGQLGNNTTQHSSTPVPVSGW